MDKTILVQYCEMKEEIKDIRARINRLEKEITNLCIVSDAVKGTRKDGTYGSIKITGYPTPEYYRRKNAIARYKTVLESKMAELLELTCQAEEYIESMSHPVIRTMFRLYYIDGLTWQRAADQLNLIFPRKKKHFTEEGCKKANQRFIKNL